MFRELYTHGRAYGVLATALILWVVLFVGAWPNRGVQRLLVLGLVAFYIGWGSLSHRRSGHLSGQIVQEYVSIGILGGVIMWLITL